MGAWFLMILMIPREIPWFLRWCEIEVVHPKYASNTEPPDMIHTLESRSELKLLPVAELLSEHGAPCLAVLPVGSVNH